VYEAVRSIDDIDHEAVRQRNGFARVLPGAVGSHHRKIQLAVLVEVASNDLLGIVQRGERERTCKRAISVAAREGKGAA